MTYYIMLSIADATADGGVDDIPYMLSTANDGLDDTLDMLSTAAGVWMTNLICFVLLC